MSFSEIDSGKCFKAIVLSREIHISVTIYSAHAIIRWCTFMLHDQKLKKSGATKKQGWCYGAFFWECMSVIGGLSVY